MVTWCQALCFFSPSLSRSILVRTKWPSSRPSERFRSLELRKGVTGLGKPKGWCFNWFPLLSKILKVIKKDLGGSNASTSKSQKQHLQRSGGSHATLDFRRWRRANWRKAWKWSESQVERTCGFLEEMCLRLFDIVWHTYQYLILDQCYVIPCLMYLIRLFFHVLCVSQERFLILVAAGTFATFAVCTWGYTNSQVKKAGTHESTKHRAVGSSKSPAKHKDSLTNSTVESWCSQMHIQSNTKRLAFCVSKAKEATKRVAEDAQVCVFVFGVEKMLWDVFCFFCTWGWHRGFKGHLKEARLVVKGAKLKKHSCMVIFSTCICFNWYIVHEWSWMYYRQCFSKLFVILKPLWFKQFQWEKEIEIAELAQFAPKAMCFQKNRFALKDQWLQLPKLSWKEAKSIKSY